MGKNVGIIILTIFLIVLFLGGGGILIYRALTPSQTVINSGTYTCPSNKYCSVTPILKCEIPTITPTVEFRATEITQAPSEIAVDYDGDGDLDAWLKDGGTGSGSVCDRTALIYGFSNTKFTYYNSHIYACNVNGNNYRYSQEGASITTSSTPTEPYASSGRELYGGDQNIYDCSKDLFIGSTKVGILSHSSNQATPSGGKQGSTYSLNENEVFSTSGTGVISLDVSSSEIPITTCLVTIQGEEVTLEQGESTCLDVHTLVSCDVPPQVNTEENEEQLCINGQWEDLYTTTIDVEATTVSVGDSFIVHFDLDDSQYSENGRTVYLNLKQGGQIVETDNGITRNGGKVDLSVTPDFPGYYELELTMSHPESDFERTYQVQVTEGLTVSTFRTVSPQYDNANIIAVIEVSKGGNPVAVFPNGDIIIDATYNGVTRHETGITTIENGEYNAYWSNLQGDGDLRFRVKVEDPSSNYVTDWTQWKTVSVKKSGLLISIIDFGDAKWCNQQSHTAKFKIVDSVGNNVNGATITLDINNNPETAVSEGSGVYSFSHYYDQGGNYNIEIFASKGDLVGSANFPMNILSCSGGGGSADEGGIDWTMWLVVGGVILAVGAFVYFVFFFRRK